MPASGNRSSVLAAGGSAEGVHLLGEETLAKTIEEQSNGIDLVLGVPIRFGLGFGLTSEEFPVGPNPRTFFWGGWGGSLVDDVSKRQYLFWLGLRTSRQSAGGLFATIGISS